MQDKSGASAQRLTPVTIAQVNAAKQQHKDDAFSVDGQELNQVSVVGTIKSVAKLSTNITLVVQDATGTIDVRQWLDSGEGQTDFVPDMRIKIVGHVREFQEKRSILAFKIVPAPDPQEAVYHQLLSTYVHLFHRFGPLPEGAETPGGAGAAGVSHSYQVKEKKKFLCFFFVNTDFFKGSCVRRRSRRRGFNSFRSAKGRPEFRQVLHELSGSNAI